MADYTPLFQQAGQQYDVDPRLLASIAQVESGGNPTAVSPAGAQGLMQLMPATAQALGVKDPTDPTQAIPAAARLISQNLDRYGNVADALRAYNAGTDQSRWSNPETAAYVPKVASAYAALAQPAAAAPAAPDQQLASNGASDVPLTSAPAVPDAFGAKFGAVAPTGQAAPAADAAGGPDAFTQAFGSAISAPDTTKPGFWTNLAAGLEHGASGSGAVGSALNQAALWGDKNIPGAAQLDNLIGRTSVLNLNSLISGKLPVDQQAVAGSAAGQQAYQQNPASKTWGGEIGNTASTVALTAPLVEAAAGGAGGLLGAGADYLGAGTAGNRLLTAARTALTGQGATTIPGKILASQTSTAAKSAAGAVGLGQDPVQAGEAGLLLGPVGLGVGAAAAPLLRRGAQLLGYAGTTAARDAASASPGSAPPSVEPQYYVNARAQNAAADAAADGSAPPVNNLTNPPGAATAPINKLTGAVQDIPSAPPKTGLVVTKAGADKAADKIISSYAAGGPTTITPSAIQGVNPTLSQVTANPGIATLERAVSALHPNQFAVPDAANQAVREQVISGLTGTPGDLESAMAYRDQATSAARTAAFANTKPVDAQPVVDQLQTLINQNAGRPTVQGPLQQVMRQLVPANADGTPGRPISDPATLYNVRHYINDLVAPRVSGETGSGLAAASQLQDLKPTLDGIIETGAPGYAAYMKQFSDLSGPIDGMKALQGLKLFDANGNVTLAKLDNAVTSLAKQQATPGFRAADGVTPEQMQQLTALRDDMRARNNNTLGRGSGSDTFQKLGTSATLNKFGSTAGHIVGAGIGAASGGLLGGTEGGIGAMIGAGVSHAAGSLNDRSNALIMESLVNKLLNPHLAAGALQKAASRSSAPP